MGRFHVSGAMLITMFDRRRRRRVFGVVLVLLGVLADEVDEQEVFLLVALGLAGDDFLEFLQEAVAVFAGFVEGEGFGDALEGSGVFFRAGVDPGQVVAGPHVGGIDREGFLVGGTGFGGAAEFVEGVAE